MGSSAERRARPGLYIYWHIAAVERPPWRARIYRIGCAPLVVLSPGIRSFGARKREPRSKREALFFASPCTPVFLCRALSLRSARTAARDVCIAGIHICALARSQVNVRAGIALKSREWNFLVFTAEAAGWQEGNSICSQLLLLRSEESEGEPLRQRKYIVCFCWDVVLASCEKFWQTDYCLAVLGTDL